MLEGHRVLDDTLDDAADIRDRPVWRPMPDDVRARFLTTLPLEPSALAGTYPRIPRFHRPCATGNVHPGFTERVHGGGTPIASNPPNNLHSF
jgi:aromatic-L-amino-acid/L-tryptophan decarboxylase